MSDCLALESSPPPNAVSKPKARAGLGDLLRAALESLVTAQSRRFQDADPISYRFPPF